MTVHYRRDEIGFAVDAERVFHSMIANVEGGFWLDDSLGETVSYLGVGSAIENANFDSFDADTNSPVARVGWISYGERESSIGVSVGMERHVRNVVLDVGWVVEFDHRDGSVMLYTRPDINAVEMVGRLSLAAVSDIPPLSMNSSTRTALWRDSTERYEHAIGECLRHITDGDAYQLCLTTAVDVPGEIDAPDTYRALRSLAPTHNGGFINAAGVSLLSASPESFLTVRGRIASTKPIKGTRRRSMDPADDFLLKHELLESAKERAENLMIVDLCRNDLSLVCETGSVTVPALHVVETYSTVHQLVSTVTGRLRGDVSAATAARALFPAGSMTGAPKVSAVEILAGLESGERGIYSGVFGFSGRGDISLSMTIRSIVVDDAGATIGVGGGITADSVPIDEVHEVGVKADALLRVLGAGPNVYLHAE